HRANAATADRVSRRRPRRTDRRPRTDAGERPFPTLPDAHRSSPGPKGFYPPRRGAGRRIGAPEADTTRTTAPLAALAGGRSGWGSGPGRPGAAGPERSADGPRAFEHDLRRLCRAGRDAAHLPVRAFPSGAGTTS